MTILEMVFSFDFVTGFKAVTRTSFSLDEGRSVRFRQLTDASIQSLEPNKKCIERCYFCFGIINQMKLLRNKEPLLLCTLLLVGLVAVALFARTSLQKTKTSIVTGTYSNSALDGCDGFILKNGDTVDTFCFWTRPEDQTDYQGSIEVGDRVEYGTKSGKQFIRPKK